PEPEPALRRHPRVVAVARVAQAVRGEVPVAERHLDLAARALLRRRARARIACRPLAIIVHRMLLVPRAPRTSPRARGGKEARLVGFSPSRTPPGAACGRPRRGRSAPPSPRRSACTRR